MNLKHILSDKRVQFFLLFGIGSVIVIIIFIVSIRSSLRDLSNVSMPDFPQASTSAGQSKALSEINASLEELNSDLEAELDQ